MKVSQSMVAISFASILISGAAFAKGSEENPVYVEGGTISVDNFPEFPATQTVHVDNLPLSQTVNGTVNVGNLPSTQNVAGTVNVGNLPATQNVNVANSVPIDVFVTNSDSPAATYHFIGVTSTRVQARMVYMDGHEDCMASFGSDAKVADAGEIRAAILDGVISSSTIGGIIPDFCTGSADCIGDAYFTPDDSISATMYWINSYGRIFEKRIGENSDLAWTACSVPEA